MSGIAPVSSSIESRLPPEAHPVPKPGEKDERRRPPKEPPREQEEGRLNVEA